MNNKYILAAVCATAFSGINLVANPPLKTPSIPKEIKNDLKELVALIQTGSIDSEEVKAKLNQIKEKTTSKITNASDILGNITTQTEEKIIDEANDIKTHAEKLAEALK